MNVLVVMGTRPEAIKLAPVVFALRKRRGLRVKVCATAQHRELLDGALEVFGLKPDLDLGLMRHGQSPADFAVRAEKALDRVLARTKPSVVVVQGDTTTALAASLAAARRGIAVAHVEAGLRSFDVRHPFPEEANRVVIDHLASLHFPPTGVARANLAAEGIAGKGVSVTGNTVVDAFRWAKGRLGSVAKTPGTRTIVATLHRRESFGAPLEKTCRALRALVESRPDLTVVFPLHPNPKARDAARRLLRHPRVKLLPPQPYLEFLRLVRGADLLITDSGGLQEEAACLGKPVLVARETTERPELVKSGAARLIGRDGRRLAREAGRILDDARLRARMGRAKNPYGDGRAAERIAAAIARF